ncbi:MAG: DUF4097 family beta strand repeat-containing protein [Pyrinomonadaceae bacterium]
MSWLYSIVFTSLLLSSANDPGRLAEPVSVPLSPAAAVTQGDERERFEQVYPLSPNGRVRVSNVNGPITVEGWERNEVKLEAVKIADTKEALADVQINVDSRADSISIEADHDAWRRSGNKGWKGHNKLEVQFRLSVPRGAVLDEIETVNGAVTVSGLTNIIKVSAVNGNVNASNLRGTANLSTVNGEVSAGFDRLETDSRISLSTVNGRVNLTIPSDANATLKASSLNGDINNDFGLPVRKGKYIGRDMHGRVGSGDAQIRLESVNGPLAVRRNSDGKSQNPATDLLPQKSEDDDDWESDTSWDSKTDKLNKEIARSVKDSAKAAELGVDIATAEIARIAPEIEKIRVESLRNFKLNEAEIRRQAEQAIRSQRSARANMNRIRWSGRNPTIEKQSKSFTVNGIPKVTIEANGCSVRIRGWDRGEVKYVLTQLDARNSAPIAVAESATDSAVTLKVLNNETASHNSFFSGGAGSVRIEVFVPSKSNLKVISNGEIRLEGVSGEVDLRGVDEEIDIRNVDGKLKLSAADGQVRVIGFQGEIDTRTGSGDVFLEGSFSRVTSSTGDGNVIVTVPENYNCDVISNVESIIIEDLRQPATVKEGQWRFGTGGPKLTFTVADGKVMFRSSKSLTEKNII